MEYSEAYFPKPRYKKTGSGTGLKILYQHLQQPTQNHVEISYKIQDDRSPSSKHCMEPKIQIYQLKSNFTVRNTKPDKLPQYYAGEDPLTRPHVPRIHRQHL